MKASIFAKVNDNIKIVSSLTRGFRLCSKIGANVTDGKIKATIDFFDEVVSLSRAHNSEKVIAVATQAARETSNFLDLQKKIFEQTGVNLQIISGIEEAKLVANSVHRSTKSKQFISFDVGCGSVEIAEFNDEIKGVWSLPISTLDLCQLDNFETAEKTIQRELATLQLSKFKTSNCPLIGSGGTLRMAALLINGKTRDFLAYAEINDLFLLLQNKTNEERVNLGVPKARADIFPFGLLIILNIMRHVGAGQLFLAADNLRMSLALDSFNMLK
jgi:exopolyphosphatase/guanosine-5'-triphosphate,3'-diphosphate pyrophosphatase